MVLLRARHDLVRSMDNQRYKRQGTMRRSEISDLSLVAKIRCRCHILACGTWMPEREMGPACVLGVGNDVTRKHADSVMMEVTHTGT